MSLNSERDMYQNIVETGMEQKPNFLECQKATDYLLLSTDDKSDQETVIEEKIDIEEEDVDDNEDLIDRIVKTEEGEPQVYFEEALGTCEEVTVDYNESSMSIPLSPPMSPTSPHARFKVKREWPQANDEERLSMHLDCEDEKGYYTEEQEQARDTNDEDEETIATFVTAAGQQLALYAVEDSEDVFAVAVYDESGEPPTNFQFLMKSDVERLIGEGAVRTVKKPSQIKRQLLTTQPPVFSSKQRRTPYTPNNEGLVSDVKSRQQKVLQKPWSNNAIINQSCQAILDTNTAIKENYSTHKQPNSVTYLMMNDATMGIIGQSEGSQESLGSENEIVEQSTVQYILLDGDQSDSELTFDEIQATLQGLKFTSNKSTKKKTSNRKIALDQDNAAKLNVNDVINDKSEASADDDAIQNSLDALSHDIPSGVPETETRISEDFIGVEENHLTTTTQSGLSELRPGLNETLNDKSSQNMSAASIEPRIKPNGLEQGKQHSINILRPNISDGHTEIRPKIKRSRKQQLTSVNRGDSEIIIQPALIGAEEDSNNKKRGRRKKKPVPDPDYNPRPVRSKKSKKAQKNPKVEIIEIDVDEEQSVLQGKKDVIEITIDDGKEKGSSDKENEIIMVGDSDDESQETPAKPIPPIMQCIHCSRNFRQKRALDTHSRVCPKSRINIDKADTRTTETASGSSSKNNLNNKRDGNKEYTCKVCQKKFDAVVVLARHARTEHQKKYRNKGGKPGVEVEAIKTKTVQARKEPSDERRVTRVSQKKKGQSSNQAWKSKKLNCNDCGRWFPSTAILAAHCLQHATKNSEKQIRQCHVCKKLIKTRSLYIQHMKTHGRATRNTKPSTTVLQKKLRQTRQVTSKLTSVKKRGRPRKL